MSIDNFRCIEGSCFLCLTLAAVEWKVGLE